MTMPTQLAPIEAIASRILLIRGWKVMIDADLAELYGVETKALNQAVKRNKERFPGEFMFQLTRVEKDEVVTKCDHLSRLKFSPNLPYAFTEHGALMLGNVLKTPRAVEVSLLVVKTFVQLRELLATNKELAAKIDELEKKLIGHDQAILSLLEAVKQLMIQPGTANRSIGFTADLADS
jgi:phage regulator Rha-like protein